VPQTGLKPLIRLADRPLTTCAIEPRRFA